MYTPYVPSSTSRYRIFPSLSLPLSSQSPFQTRVRHYSDLFVSPEISAFCSFFCCGKWGPLFIAVRGPLTITASLVVEHRLQRRRLSNCGSRAQSLRGMWDPPRPGLEPVSPALAGRFSTTAPPGKPMLSVLELHNNGIILFHVYIYVLFYVWLSSLRIMSMIFTHIVTSIIHSPFFLIAERNFYV